MRHLKFFVALCLLLLCLSGAQASNELKATNTASTTVYAVILNPSGQAWNGTSFAAYADANWSTYAVTLGEKGASVFYVGDMPAGIVTSGRYTVAYFQRAGGAAALSDALVGQGTVDWNGSAVATLITLPTDIWAATTRTLSAFAFTPNVANVTGTLPIATLPTLPPTGYGNLGYFYAPVADTINGSTTPALVVTVTNPNNNNTSRLITWTADTSATGYKVLRSVNGTAYTVIAIVGSGVTTYTDLARPNNGTVYYSIIASH